MGLKGKLGRKPAIFKEKTLNLSRYSSALPDPPLGCDGTHGITQWGDLGNFTVGDCAFAADFHAIQSWRLSLNPSLVTFLDDEVVRYYSAWEGYNPGDPSTDQGTSVLPMLTRWRKSTLAGHNLKAFVSVDPTNEREVKLSVQLFGGAYLGIRFMSNFGEQPGSTWGHDPSASCEGGHAIWVPKYDASGIYPISWGSMYLIPWDSLQHCTEEGYALLSDTDWMNPNQSLFDYSSLNKDLALVTA